MCLDVTNIFIVLKLCWDSNKYLTRIELLDGGYIFIFADTPFDINLTQTEVRYVDWHVCENL